MSLATLADRLHDALPQTQCTRCGFADCRGYAEAMAEGRAEINQCPPGGAEGIERLARLTGREALALNPAHGEEGPRRLAVIDEEWCIGCALCIKACPVDCIVGAPKQMHTVIDALCTGCELCVPVCPVDCIAVAGVTGERSGWSAWSEPQAAQARARYASHQARAQHEAAAGGRPAQAAPADDDERKRALIGAALARARAHRSTADAPGDA